MAEVECSELADYKVRLDSNDIKFWPDATQKMYLSGQQFRFSFLIGVSSQTTVTVPFLSETAVHVFGYIDLHTWNMLAP